jgi:hypothetical protein
VHPRHRSGVFEALQHRCQGRDSLERRRRHDGADQILLKSTAGNERAGFRRYGPSPSAGHLRMMMVVNCAPQDTPLAPAEVTAFVDSGKTH